MALKKTMVPAEFEGKGLTAPMEIYWKIVSLSADLVNKQSEIRINGYASEQAKTDRKSPIESKIFVSADDKYVFDLENLSVDGMNPVKYAYLKLKESEFFQGALDV